MTSPELLSGIFLVLQIYGWVWLVGMLARIAEWLGLIYWPWPPREDLDPDWRNAQLIAYAIYFAPVREFFALLLLLWPARGLVVLCAWAAWHIVMRHRTP